MNISRLATGLISTALVTASGVCMSAVSTAVSIQPAHAQSAGQHVQTLRGCFINTPFSGTIAFNPTNIRQQPTTASSIVGTFTRIGEVVQFSGFTTGAAVNDAWDQQPDNMWYRLADGRGFVASAVTKGYPPRGNNCSAYTHPLRGAGSVTQGPGGSTSHTGRSQYAIDYGVNVGTPVYAMRSGKIVQIQDNFPTWGANRSALANSANWVVIEHGDGTYGAYVHLQNASARTARVSVGQTVGQGQLIGYSGSSGWSTGPHLHVEVQRGLWGQTIPFSVR